MIFLSTVSNYTARIETTDFNIHDAVIGMSDQTLPYLLIDISPWQENQLALVSTKLIQTIDDSAQRILFSADMADIAKAPKFADLGGAWIEALPPVVIGPFGNTVSPLMMAAALKPQASAPDVNHIDTARHHRFSTLRGVDVFGKDGKLGQIDDLIAQQTGLGIAYLVIAADDSAAHARHIVPVQKFRHFAKQATHIVLDITSQDLADAPRLDRGAPLDAGWLAKLHAFYRLSV